MGKKCPGPVEAGPPEGARQARDIKERTNEAIPVRWRENLAWILLTSGTGST